MSSLDPVADVVIDAHAGGGRRVAIAVVDGVIAAVDDRDPGALVARWTGPTTEHLEVQGHLHPLFVDTHNHLVLTARNEVNVRVRDVSSIPELLARVRAAAERTARGAWIVTGADWHEVQLVERRLPTAAELDTAARDHPVLVLRGGHNGVLNSEAMRRAGIAGADSEHVLRDDRGAPTGHVREEVLFGVQRLLPRADRAALLAALDTVTRRYREHGLGTVRDAMVTPDDWDVLTAAKDAGSLHVRTHAMLFSPVELVRAAGGIDPFLDGLEARGLRPGTGDDRLRVWGVKLVLDGGVEAAALDAPYSDRPGSVGSLFVEPDELLAVLSATVRRGWPVGAHAVGERAIRQFLDAVEAVRATGAVPAPGALVLEHAALITPELIARAAALGVQVTGQQALRDGLIQPWTSALGRDRVARMFPWRSMLAAGLVVSAGTDHPIGPLDPIAGILGMTTRDTPLGVLGAGEAIDRAAALQLYTSAGADLVGAAASGRLAVGAPADIALWPVDLTRTDDGHLVDARPSMSLLAGRDDLR